MNKTPRSVYRRGAEDGLLMAPLLAVVVSLFGAMPFVSWLFFPTMLLAATVPVLAYILLKRGYAEDMGKSTFSALWLHGICIFFFGSLLMAVFTFAMMRWAFPNYIIDMMRMCIDVLNAAKDAQASQLADVFEKAIKTGQIPQAIDIVIELIYLAVLTGSMLSMLLSLIIRSGRKPSPTPPPFNN